jgi:ubiquinone/menaquinone biosynthesis C-methylase UbiE
LLHERFAGDEMALSGTLDFLEPIRDRVLLGAGIARGDVVLDVGCGDGLIGFGALPWVDEAGQVVFVDLSEELLERCRQIASQLAVSDRCRFVRTPAETLNVIDDSSVDAVSTRSEWSWTKSQATLAPIEWPISVNRSRPSWSTNPRRSSRSSSKE